MEKQKTLFAIPNVIVVGPVQYGFFEWALEHLKKDQMATFIIDCLKDNIAQMLTSNKDKATVFFIDSGTIEIVDLSKVGLFKLDDELTALLIKQFSPTPEKTEKTEKTIESTKKVEIKKQVKKTTKKAAKNNKKTVKKAAKKRSSYN